MKYLICTRADSNIKQQSDISHEIIKNYADKCNAEFLILDKMSDCEHGDGRWHFKIFEIKNLLEKYDRIFQIDTDTIINKNCPNIFNEVPEDHIGTIFEDYGTRLKNRRDKIKNIQNHWGDIGWKSGYINTGVFVVSKQHNKIFEKHNNAYWTDWGSDDMHLGYKIRQYKFKIFELNYKWNHMTMFSESWNNNADRFDSNIIHYAGQGKFDQKNRIEQMSHDRKIIWGY